MLRAAGLPFRVKSVHGGTTGMSSAALRKLVLPTQRVSNIMSGGENADASADTSEWPKLDSVRIV